MSTSLAAPAAGDWEYRRHEGLFGSCVLCGLRHDIGRWDVGGWGQHLGGDEPFHPASEMPDHVRCRAMWVAGLRGMLGYVSI